MTRPFRFGLFGETTRTRATLLDTARRAEEGGFSTFLIRDHFIEEPFGHQLAPIAALATVAAATTRLRVGSMVFASDYRHPALLAKEVATLDVLSSGRVELGLGAGFSQREYERAGMRFDPPGVRVSRLEETIRVLKGLFADGPFTFAGTHHAVTDLDGYPKPVQRPHPPFFIGAAGNRMLSIAAREADIIGLQTVSTAGGVVANDPRVRLPDAVAAKVDQIRRMAGARFGQIELSMVATIVVTDDRRGAAERIARDRGWDGFAADRVLEMPSLFIGSLDGIAEDMHARRERYGFSYYALPDRALDEATPLVARLAGT
jgi:probable F420-dependent oxidoreductase